MDLGPFIPLSAIILGIGLGFFGTWTSHKQKLAKLRLQADAQDSARHADRMQELEERVRVLERIVTDRDYELASQIEALREPAAQPVRPAERERA